MRGLIVSPMRKSKTKLRMGIGSGRELVEMHSRMGEPDDNHRAALQHLAYSRSSLTTEEREALRDHLRECSVCLDYYCWTGRESA